MHRSKARHEVLRGHLAGAYKVSMTAPPLPHPRWQRQADLNEFLTATQLSYRVGEHSLSTTKINTTTSHRPPTGSTPAVIATDLVAAKAAARKWLLALAAVHPLEKIEFSPFLSPIFVFIVCTVFFGSDRKVAIADQYCMRCKAQLIPRRRAWATKVDGKTRKRVKNRVRKKKNKKSRQNAINNRKRRLDQRP